MEYQTGRNDINMEKEKRNITFNEKVKLITEEQDEENGNKVVKTVTPMRYEDTTTIIILCSFNLISRKELIMMRMHLK